MISGIFHHGPSRELYWDLTAAVGCLGSYALFLSVFSSFFFISDKFFKMEKIVKRKNFSSHLDKTTVLSRLYFIGRFILFYVTQIHKGFGNIRTMIGHEVNRETTDRSQI
jgi:hypothetical protein